MSNYVQVVRVNPTVCSNQVCSCRCFSAVGSVYDIWLPNLKSMLCNLTGKSVSRMVKSWLTMAGKKCLRNSSSPPIIDKRRRLGIAHAMLSCPLESEVDRLLLNFMLALPMKCSSKLVTCFGRLQYVHVSKMSSGKNSSFMCTSARKLSWSSFAIRAAASKINPDSVCGSTVIDLHILLGRYPYLLYARS